MVSWAEIMVRRRQTDAGGRAAALQAAQLQLQALLPGAAVAYKNLGVA